ncbi:hypothetical protein GRJ2_001649600 [Grus japonensis]|uniref:Uncharacterized protein n=1 Tax=Grus japonensis TaxID=30415 RepID=A0ABC9X2E7_GRUJA
MRRGFLKGQQGSQVQAWASVFKLSLKNYTLVTGIWLGQILLAAPDPKPARVNGKGSANSSECWIGALNVQPGGKTFPVKHFSTRSGEAAAFRDDFKSTIQVFLEDVIFKVVKPHGSKSRTSSQRADHTTCKNPGYIYFSWFNAGEEKEGREHF